MVLESDTADEGVGFSLSLAKVQSLSSTDVWWWAVLYVLGAGEGWCDGGR